jgi:c-di-GMP-related signal transduction protein
MKIRMLAEKVETYDDFQRTPQWVYSYFQGCFFSRPEMLSRGDIPSNKLNYLLVLQAVNREQMDIDDVSERIKAEASLSFGLLRYLNFPTLPLIGEVRSIPLALSLLGERGTRKWVSLIVVACMADGKPAELVTLPLNRARFSNFWAPARGWRNPRTTFCSWDSYQPWTRSSICACPMCCGKLPSEKRFAMPCSVR